MLRVTTIALAVLALTVSAFADTWHIESVDTEGYVGYYTSLALDASGNPHISYVDLYTNDYLKYAYHDGSCWHIENVDYTGSEGGYTSIAVDASDNPHISYYDDAAEDLKYAYYDGSSWQIEYVDTEGHVGTDTSIALDAFDNPHISYYCYDGTNGVLKYAYYDGSSWQTESLDTRAGLDTSIALDASDNPRISYRTTYHSYDLKYAYYDGSSWQTELVDTGTVGGYTSIALDSSDDPHISYYYYFNSDLMYACYDGSSWHTESVDTEGSVGTWTSIALDASDNPHISYCDFTNHDLKYAYYDGSSWQIEPVDTEEWVGGCSSIALDTSNNPHISYYDSWNYDLKYAWYGHNTPPADFDLLSPADGDYVSDAPAMDWEDAEDDQPVTYDLWYSEETDFEPHAEINDLTDSTYTFSESVLTDDTTYCWKVRAYDGHEETWSGPDEYWSFTVDYELDIKVSSFSADSIADGIEVSWECADEVTGFNLYRSEGSEERKAITSLNKLNAGLITGESPYEYLDAAVEADATYGYWLEAIDVRGAAETFGPVECTWRGALPTSYALYQSRPNPASGTATIAFDLPEDAKVTLTIYDLTGRKVTTVVDETLTIGTHERTISGLAPGVYVYKLDAGTFSAARKMVVVE